MKNVLVTGGAGYIGSHVCKTLAQQGYLPVVYDDLSQGHAWAVRWGPLEQGCILDRDRLSSLLSEYRPVAVMHFAALGSIAESVVDPLKYYRINIAGTQVVLEAAIEHGIGNFVFSSSCATYGGTSNGPITETAQQRPVNPYGRSKLMVEQMLHDCQNAHPIRPIILRYFNAAGADLDGEIGECHEPETHLVPLTLDAASGYRDKITINGGDFDTFDGTCIRDYVHVSDLAEAHCLALRALEEGIVPTAFNLGIGQGYSVRQVVDTACTVTGRDVPVKLGQRRPGDPACLVSDASKARTTLGWRPRFSDLSTIVESAWTWHNRNRETSAREVKAG